MSLVPKSRACPNSSRRAEPVTQKLSAQSVRNNLTVRDRRVGARAQPVPSSGGPVALPVNTSGTYDGNKRSAASTASPGTMCPVSSHKVILSDSSDAEDVSATVATHREHSLQHDPLPCGQHLQVPTQQPLSPPPKIHAGALDPPRSTGQPTPPRRAGPAAAALSGRVMATVRRRAADQGQQSQPQLGTAPARRVAVNSRSNGGCTTSEGGNGRSKSRHSEQRQVRSAASGSAAPWVAILALVAAAAALSPLLRMAPLRGAVHRRHDLARVPSASYPPSSAGREVARPATGAWTSSSGPSRGGISGVGAASSVVSGTWINRLLPYMTVGGGLSTARRFTGGVSPSSTLGGDSGSVAIVPIVAAATNGGSGGGGGGGRFRTGGGQLPALAVAAGGSGGGGGEGEGEGAAAGASRAPLQGPDLEWRESATARVITIVSGAPSPYRTTWDDLAAHTSQRLEWTDPAFQMLVFRQEQLGRDPATQGSFLRALQGGSHMVVGLDVTDPGAERFLRDPRVTSQLPGAVLFVGGGHQLAHDLTQLPGGLRPQDPGSWRTALARRLPWTPDGGSLALWDTLQLLLGRHDSDNFLFVYLVLINQYVTTVRQVADTTKGFDLQSIFCMVKHCGSKVVGCVRDTACKSALDCLNACTFNDQVCQYRCIVSHESPLLEAFSLCILQLHNCRNLDAKPPLLPDPAPLSSFRGPPLTHEAAEDLFIGWLDQPRQGAPAGTHLGSRPGKAFSWLVAAGKNPAYDYFPCQHQLFYRGRSRGSFWYEPVFKAITLDGREVWRRRVYRVRRGQVPGTFHLSVLDNGVTSSEFWRILDCEEDLDYCLFYYSGAAATAGLSYSGAVLGTPDGRMPGPQHTARLHAALRRAGIEPWELSYVDNSRCEGVPLQITGPVPAPAALAAA